MHRISSLVDRLAYGLFILGVVGGILMALLIFVSTTLRYAVGTPVNFSDEMAGLLFFSMSFLSLPHVLNQDRHIRIDLLTRAMPAAMARLAGVFASLVLIAFACVFAWESWSFMRFSQDIDARSDISGLLLWPWMTLMPAALLLCVIIQLRKGLVPVARATSHEEPL